MSNVVTTAVRASEKREAQGVSRVKEKADRATVEQVLDPRTRMVLFKMLNRGVFSEINGFLSTGKEVKEGGGGGKGKTVDSEPKCTDQG